MPTRLLAAALAALPLIAGFVVSAAPAHATRIYASPSYTECSDWKDTDRSGLQARVCVTQSYRYTGALVEVRNRSDRARAVRGRVHAHIVDAEWTPIRQRSGLIRVRAGERRVLAHTYRDGFAGPSDRVRATARVVGRAGRVLSRHGVTAQL